METRTAGWFFILIGVAIMTLSVILVILGFLNIIKPAYFKSSPAPNPTVSSGGSLDINSLLSGQVDQSQLEQINSKLGQSNSSIQSLPGLNFISSDDLENSINLSIHFFLMVFIGGFGYKLAMIGVNLVRPIVIKSGGKVLETETLVEAVQSTKPTTPQK